MDLKYIKFIQNEEQEVRGFTRVPNMSYPGRKPKLVCGIVLSVSDSDLNFYVGLTSYKIQKSENILINVKGDSNPIKGSLRFNYMFPVPDKLLTPIKIEDETDQFYKDLLTKEYRFIDKNKEIIRSKAKEVYTKITTDSCSENLRNFSCDFKLLEKACIKYCKDHSISLP